MRTTIIIIIIILTADGSDMEIKIKTVMLR